MKRTKQQTLPSGSWVRVKEKEALRFITKVVNSVYFYDDGKISGQPPSPHCYFHNYELFIAI